MAVEQKTINIFLIILLVIALVLGVVGLVKASQPPVPVDPNAPPPPPGLGTAFGNILSNVFSSNWWKNIFKKDAIFSPEDCDPNRIGYTKDGKYDTRCTVFTPKDLGCTGACDPNRLGWNDCGLPDNNCY